MKAVDHMSAPRPTAYGDSSAGYPVRSTVAVHLTRSSRSASMRPAWPRAVWYSPPMVHRTTAAPATAPSDSVQNTLIGRTPRIAPATRAHRATGGRNSSWSSHSAPCTAHVSASAMTSSRPRLSQPAFGYSTRSRRSATRPLPPADGLGKVVAPAHEAMLDVVLGQRVADRGELGARVVVGLHADVRGSVEEDDQRRNTATPERRQATDPGSVGRARDDAQRHATAQL